MQEQNNQKKHLMDLLEKNQVIKFGKFILSSGKESDYYVDMKKAHGSRPEGRFQEEIGVIFRVCSGRLRKGPPFFWTIFIASAHRYRADRVHPVLGGHE